MVEYFLESWRGGTPMKVDNEVEEEMNFIFEVVMEVLMAVTHGGPSFGGCEGPPFAGPCCQAGVGGESRKLLSLHSTSLFAQHCTALHCVAP